MVVIVKEMKDPVEDELPGAPLSWMDAAEQVVSRNPQKYEGQLYKKKDVVETKSKRSRKASKPETDIQRCPAPEDEERSETAEANSITDVEFGKSAEALEEARSKLNDFRITNVAKEIMVQQKVETILSEMHEENEDKQEAEEVQEETKETEEIPAAVDAQIEESAPAPTPAFAISSIHSHPTAPTPKKLGRELDEDMTYIADMIHLTVDTVAALIDYDARTLEDFSMMTKADLEEMILSEAKGGRPVPPLQQRKLSLLLDWVRNLADKHIFDQHKHTIRSFTSKDEVIDPMLVSSPSNYQLLPYTWKDQFLHDLPLMKQKLRQKGSSTGSIFSWMFCGSK